jgi:hypothetical protein
MSLTSRPDRFRRLSADPWRCRMAARSGLRLSVSGTGFDFGRQMTTRGGQN